MGIILSGFGRRGNGRAAEMIPAMIRLAGVGGIIGEEVLSAECLVLSEGGREVLGAKC